MPIAGPDNGRDGAGARPGTKQVAIIFGGGVGLGAYQAGAYAVLHRRTDIVPTWLAGSSIGAVNAALIAGNPESKRLEVLSEFWSGPDRLFAPRLPERRLRHAQNWLSVIAARLVGVPGQFHPEFGMNLLEPFSSLYDLTPLRLRLERLVDFDRLNAGAPRLSVATTDIETGDLVVFDTGRGDRIEIQHLLASCGFLPEFAPLEIDGKLLGDGGLAANAPVETVLLEDPLSGPQTVFVLDLFSRDDGLPTDLESALARKNDLLFANQTYLRLRACVRERNLRRGAAAETEPDAVFYLSFRAPPEEAGPEKPYDYSSNSLSDRWQAGVLDMQEALDQSSPSGTGLREIRRK